MVTAHHTAQGRREVLGMDVGEGEGGAFLGRVPARAEDPRSGWRATGHLRRTFRAEASNVSSSLGSPDK